jgi:pimeloyl-ACP methyl ester carboxylesterase
MAALVPGSSLVVVPDSGHMTPLEQPETVTRALRDWLGAS